MMMRSFSFFLFFLLLSCSHGSLLQKESDEVFRFVLPNGATLLVIENRRLPLLSFYSFYKVGSRNETKGLTGATHFLEHLMFKGKTLYKGKRFDQMIEKKGGMSNAYTNYDHTVYYESVSSDMLEDVMQMESDRMGHLDLDRGEFEKERLVILEERKMRYENRPDGKLYLEMMTQMMQKTPYQESVIGSVDDITNVTYEEIMDYYHRFYSPNNVVLVVAGDVQKEEVLRLAQKYYGKLPARESLKNEKEAYGVAYPQGVVKGLVGRTLSPMVLYSFEGASLGEDRGYALDLLSLILTGGESSYLVQKYVKSKNAPLQSVSSENDQLTFRGVFSLSMNLWEGSDPLAFRERFLKEKDLFCDEAITEQSLQKVKNQYLVSFYGQRESNSDLASFYGIREVLFKDPFHYKAELEIYQKFSVGDMKKICQGLFLGKGNFFYLMPEKKEL